MLVVCLHTIEYNEFTAIYTFFLSCELVRLKQAPDEEYKVADDEPSERDREPFEPVHIAISDAFPRPRAMMVIVSNTHATCTAMNTARRPKTLAIITISPLC